MLVTLITPRCFATYLLVDLEASIQRVKTAALRFENGEGELLIIMTQYKTLSYYKTIYKSLY